MDLDKFSERAQDVAARAAVIIKRYGHPQVDNEHILLALIEQENGAVSQILEYLKINVVALNSRVDQLLRSTPRSPELGFNGNPTLLTSRVNLVVDLAQKEARRMGDSSFSTEHLFLALLTEAGTPLAGIFREFSISHSNVLNAISDLRKVEGPFPTRSEGNYKTLEKYSRDLTQAARLGKLDPVYGREVEIMRLIQILCRRTKNNPVLIGEAGVGKTAIAEGLAQKVIQDDVPEILSGRRVISLDLAAMLAGARYRGEFEERLKNSIVEVQSSNGEIILFVDELHTVVGAGAAQGSLDASNILKPALARGDLQCIGATTPDEYHKYIEKDAALERRFAPIYVEEPSVDETVKILGSLRSRYEAHHKVNISDQALVSAAKLSSRYMTGRKLPDKAIDLMDEAAAKLRVALYSLPEELKEMKKDVDRLAIEEEKASGKADYETAARKMSERLVLEKEFEQRRSAWIRENNLDDVVGADDIASVIHQWTGIPATQLLEAESDKLVHMEERLSEKVVGQEDAIHAISDAIRRARSGIKDPNRPIGSFIFVGPSGVGKTWLAKVLAEFLFDDDDALVRLDMSEYREQHSVSRLFGAPPGYVGYEEGGQLTEAVRRRPYRVILFDEIEKAHPEVWNALLQILDDGRLTDGQGRVVDFRNTVLIMTSNLGTEYVHHSGALGFVAAGADVEEKEMHRKIEKALKDAFRPEFLNRVDETIVFAPLTQKDIEGIIRLQVDEIIQRLSENGIRVKVEDSALTWLAQQGYDPQFGARPVKRALQKYVESPLSMHLLEGRYQNDDSVAIRADESGEGLIFEKLVAAFKPEPDYNERNDGGEAEAYNPPTEG